MLALPLNDTTRGIIDAAMLARMKPGGLLVNVARGPLVVTADLVAALESKRLAGAVMDVTDPGAFAAGRAAYGTCPESSSRRTWAGRAVGGATT